MKIPKIKRLKMQKSKLRRERQQSEGSRIYGMEHCGRSASVRPGKGHSALTAARHFCQVGKAAASHDCEDI